MVPDAVDGYHTLPLDKASKSITKWMGSILLSLVTTGIPSIWGCLHMEIQWAYKGRKVKCIDDTCLWDPNIASAFYHSWDYLTLCTKNGIVINKEKFHFYRDEVLFTGLKITKTGIAPSDHILSSTQDFPIHKNITDAMSWFGLIDQVAWADSLSPFMEPLCELVKSNTKFHWDNNLTTYLYNLKSY